MHCLLFKVFYEERTILWNGWQLDSTENIYKIGRFQLNFFHRINVLYILKYTGETLQDVVSRGWGCVAHGVFQYLLFVIGSQPVLDQ